MDLYILLHALPILLPDVLPIILCFSIPFFLLSLFFPCNCYFMPYILYYSCPSFIFLPKLLYQEQYICSFFPLQQHGLSPHKCFYLEDSCQFNFGETFKKIYISRKYALWPMSFNYATSDSNSKLNHLPLFIYMAFSSWNFVMQSVHMHFVVMR